MKLTINHRDADIIMRFLFEEYDVCGDEEHLENEPLINLMGQSGVWELESYLEKALDEEITIREDIKFIQK